MRLKMRCNGFTANVGAIFLYNIICVYIYNVNERQANCPVTNTLPLYCSGGSKMGVFFGVRPP